jgi:hypothetical protein
MPLRFSVQLEQGGEQQIKAHPSFNDAAQDGSGDWIFRKDIPKAKRWPVVNHHQASGKVFSREHTAVGAVGARNCSDGDFHTVCSRALTQRNIHCVDAKVGTPYADSCRI